MSQTMLVTTSCGDPVPMPIAIPAANVPSPRTWAWKRGSLRIPFAVAIRDVLDASELRAALAELVPSVYLTVPILSTIRLADRGEVQLGIGRIEWEHTLDETNQAVLDIHVNPRDDA